MTTDTTRHGASMRSRLLLSNFGAGLIGVGAGVGIQADLGVTTFNALTSGMNNTLGISVGVAAAALALAMVIAGRVMGVPLGVGAVAGIIVPSVVVDVTLFVVGPIEMWPMRVLGFVLGFVAVNAGAFLMVRANVGVGPVEALMLGLRRFGISIAAGRTAIEVTCVVIGFALGGVVGIGTLLYTFAMGPLLSRAIRRWPPYPSRSSHPRIG